MLDRDNELEFLQIPAPIQAYEGLQALNEIIADSPAQQEPIAMQPVDSWMASAVGYNATEKILQVEFHSGAMYQYSGVEPDTWDDFYLSDSIGGFFNNEIKGKYECKRIDDTEYPDDDCC